jgi:CHASE3 domain sensor protein
MKKTTLNTILILATALLVVAGVVLYLENQKLNTEIDTLIEQGGYTK